jgi:hypothetical protein
VILRVSWSFCNPPHVFMSLFCLCLHVLVVLRVSSSSCGPPFVLTKLLYITYSFIYVKIFTVARVRGGAQGYTPESRGIDWNFSLT